MTLEEATKQITAVNTEEAFRMLTIREFIKEYRAQQGLSVLTLEEITAESVEINVLWTT